MKISRILFLAFILVAINAPHTFSQTTLPTQCADGIDNDGDGGIDFNGLTAPDGKKFPLDKECLTASIKCENGASECPAVASGGNELALKVVINNPLKVATIQDAIKLFMDAVLKIAIPFIVIFFIWSGLSFVLARGNPEKIKTAKNMFLYTIIGTLLILGAWTITNAIIGTVNSITG
jgi:hypothetical protein